MLLIEYCLAIYRAGLTKDCECDAKIARIYNDFFLEDSFPCSEQNLNLNHYYRMQHQY